jgi:hypothetical protein
LSVCHRKRLISGKALWLGAAPGTPNAWRHNGHVPRPESSAGGHRGRSGSSTERRWLFSGDAARHWPADNIASIIVDQIPSTAICCAPST